MSWVLPRVAARSGAASGCHPPCEHLALAPIWLWPLECFSGWHGGWLTIAQDELERIRTIASEWSADNGCPHPASMRVVATTMNAAVKIVSGPGVTAFSEDATYLVVVEGDFVLQEALDRGARQAPAGRWACLMIKRHLSRVSSLVLRRAEAAPDVGALGRVYTTTGT